jgi:hypothetical protein
MKYILTEKELEQLVDRKEVEKRDIALEAARIMILVLNGNLKSCGRAYCEDCPIDSVNLDNKLHIADYNISKLICRQFRQHSK